MIERLGFTLHLDTGTIDYLSSNPIVYQGSQYEYYMDFDFLKNGSRVLFDNDTIITIVFRRPDGNVSSPLLLERETENGEGTFSIFSILLKSNWFFYKAGNLAFTLTVKKIINAGEEDETEQILSTANGYINVVASADFDVSAPIPPSAYTEVLDAIQDNANDISGLDGRLTTAEGNITSLGTRTGTLEGKVQNIETKNPLTEVTGTATTEKITLTEKHLDNSTTTTEINFPSAFATEYEAETIAQGLLDDYDTNTIQPKFDEIDDELLDTVHYFNLQDAEIPATQTSVYTATNVSEYINGKAINNIFENNGLTVKKATADKNGYDITTTYSKLLYNHFVTISTGSGLISTNIITTNANTFTTSFIKTGYYLANGMHTISGGALKLYRGIRIFSENGELKATLYYSQYALSYDSRTILGTTIRYVDGLGQVSSGTEDVSILAISDIVTPVTFN